MRERSRLDRHAVESAGIGSGLRGRSSAAKGGRQAPAGLLTRAAAEVECHL